MKLIVGLGNPGEKYANTRHNLGFLVIEQFFKDASSVKDTNWIEEGKFKSDSAQLEWNSKKNGVEKVILVRPKTYMNNSGQAVQLVSAFYKIEPADTWIVYDELDLPLGSMKIRNGGASAGHKGVESIIEHLGTDKFWRFRLGIGHAHNYKDGEPLAKHKMHDVDDFVLGKFHQGETGKVRELIKRGSKAIAEALESGIESAMNRYNTK